MSDQSSTASQDLSDIDLIFVRSEVDDAGLTPAEFRVYCHIARRAGRGESFCGVRSMAEVCKLNKGTVVAAVEELELRGMICVTKTTGGTNHYRLTKKSEWKAAVPLNSTPTVPSNRTPRSLKPYTPFPETVQTVPFEGTKGNPIKVIQEGNPIKEKDRDALVSKMRATINGFFKAQPNLMWKCPVEQAFAEVLRSDGAEQQLESISQLYKVADETSVPRSPKTLFENWDETFLRSLNLEREKPRPTRNYEPPNRNAGTFNDGKGEKYEHLVFRYKPPQ